MNRYVTICVLACFAFIIIQTTPTGAQEDFKPAIFHGLTIGKAKIADVKREFGNPVEQTDDRHGSIYMFYKDIGPAPGTVEISADKKTQRVWFVAVYPGNLSLDAAKQLFGNGYRTIRYASDTCLDKGGEGPIYESPNGSLEFIVYPALGIAIHPEQGRARDITYRATPLPKKSQCKGKSPGN